MRRPHILLDPGHGGQDPGAVAGNAREASINLAMAQKLGPMLWAEGFDVSYTRYHDQSLALSTRVDLAEVIHPDLFLSLHCNAAENKDASGIEVWTSPGQTPADDAATYLFSALKERNPEIDCRTDYTDGDPDKEARFYVLRKTNCPAVLLEMGFVTNWLDRVNLLKEEFRMRTALAICCGLVAWRNTIHG